MNKALFVFASIVLCASCEPALAAVTASMDRDHVASGETVRLLLQRDGKSDSQPDISPLKRDFDVLSANSGSSVQIVNGDVSSKSQVDLVLAPKRDGKMQVPSLLWNGEQSQALELTVGGPSDARTQGTDAPNDATHVFFTETLDQKQPYVQAAVVLTLRLYTDEPLDQASLDLLPSGDLLVKQLGKDRQTSETRGGHQYQVIERKYLLFPQRSGHIDLDGPVLVAQVPDTGGADPFADDGSFGSLFRRAPFASLVHATRPLHLHAKPIELNVLPRPIAMTGANWLPAQALTLREIWGSDNASVHVGEPLTRHLHLDALGLTGAQLPDLSSLMSVPDGIKAYPDQAKVDDTPQRDTVVGSRDQDIALIPNQSGRFSLPSVRLSWWDTTSNTQREALLPAHSFEVLPAAAGSVSSLAPQAPVSTPPVSKSIGLSDGAGVVAARFADFSPWRWIALACGALWLGTTLAWWRSRRKHNEAPKKILDEIRPNSSNAASAFKAFQKACQDADPRAARRHLLAWASASRPSDPPTGLKALSRLLDDAKLIEPLRKLDRACYTNGAWEGEDLARLFPRSHIRKVTPERDEELSELYP